MAIAKCRLEVWNPTISGTATNKWVVAQTPENKNALISVYYLDKLANPRNAEVTVSNRAKNFTDEVGTFVYSYQDLIGNTVANVNQPKRTGVLTNFFKDFQFVRLIDQYSNQVFFAGRVLSIKDTNDKNGQYLTLKLIDALYELQSQPLKSVVDSITFTGGTHTVTDMVKAFVATLYKKEYLRMFNLLNVNSWDTLAIDEPENETPNILAQLILGTTYTADYLANIVTDDTGTGSRHRFVTEDAAVNPIPSNRTVDFTKMKKTGILGEILSLLQANPQGTQGANENFGWDYFVDPNISYGGHADFRGKNLDKDTPPPPQMLNVFERGRRLEDLNPSNYGLTVKYPAGSAVSTQGHKNSSLSTPQYATKPMSVDFEFTKPKENLYSSVLMKYNDGAATEQNDGTDRELIMEIMYVTSITGLYRWSGITTVNGKIQTDSWNFVEWDSEGIPIGANEVAASTGVSVTEWASLYATDSSGNKAGLIRSQAARVQFQSTTFSVGTAVGYIIVTQVCNEFRTLADGVYILQGRGNGSGVNGSNATCKINLGASVANLGYPRRVWGIDKQKTISKGVIKDLHVLRQEAASVLSRSSKEIVEGKFSISGPPMYYWDGRIKTPSAITGGQAIHFQDVDNTVHVHLQKYGFREGMVIAKMTAGYSSIAQVNERDVYGYCFKAESDTQYHVNLTEEVNFADGDPVRVFIPLRAGDSLRVENLLADVQANLLITELTYTEEPNQMTRFAAIGVNEGFGLGTSGFLAAISDLREESDRMFNIPKGHQLAIWTGEFRAVDNNTVQWVTSDSRAEVILADKTLYNIDTATTNNNNTTDAAGTDGGSVRFGLATPPDAGDETVYYIYVDPNTESIHRGLESHFYTRPSTTPETGTDPVYKQDGDNIVIGWMKAGATADDTAEFGVFRDSKPGEGKRNATTLVHNGSLTSALLKKGARPWTSNVSIRGTAYNAIVWDNGTVNTDATLNFSDGSDTITITDGTKTSGLADNTTNYMYLDGVTGSITPSFTTAHATSIGDAKILLALVVVGDNTKGLSPTIIPFNSKIPTLNAVAIAADAIVADHIAAGTISASHIVAAGLPGSVLTIDSSATFGTGYNPIEKAKTTAASSYPSSPNTGDLFVHTGENNNLYRWSGSAWVLFDLGLARATANTGVSNAATAQTAADDAQDDADAAKSDLSDIYADGKITPSEKYVAKRLYTDITSEYAGVLAEGTEYGISTSNYTSYYNTLVSYIGSIGVFSSMTTTSSGLTRSTWDARWSDYYTHRQVLLNAIARKAKIDGIDVAGTKRTTFVDAQTSSTIGPAAIALGDIWINATDQKMYGCQSLAGNKNVIGTNWILRNDAGAINNATTNINGGRILTQAIILKAGGAGNPNNTNSILSEAHDTNSITGTRILLHNTGIFGYNGSDTAQFYIQASDGKAAFDGGAILLDEDGINIYTASGGTLKTRFDKDGMSFITGPTTALDFRSSVPSGSINALMNTTGDGSSTYGSNSNNKMTLWTDKLDITLEATAQDIGLFPDSIGYIKIGDRPLVFMDSTDRTAGLHSANMDFVGWWKLTGSIEKSTVYRLPWGASTTSPSDGQVLAIDGSGSGTGTPTDPFLFNLEWVTASGGGGSGDITAVLAGDGLTGGSYSGNATLTLGTPSTLTSSTSNAITTSSHTHAVTGLGSTGTLIFERVVVTAYDTSYTWAATGSVIATANDDDLYFIISDSITIERVTSGQVRGVRWNLAPTVTTAHTWDENQTFNGEIILPNDSAFIGAVFNSTYDGVLWKVNGRNICYAISNGTNSDYLWMDAAIDMNDFYIYDASVVYAHDGGAFNLPVFTFKDDVDTGMYSTAANKVGLVGNGQICLTADGSSGTGKVGIGANTAPVYELDIDGTARSDSAAFVVNSDERIKENIVDLEDALSTLVQLRPRKFNLISEYRPNNTATQTGFIAQEFREIIPEAIHVLPVQEYGGELQEDGTRINMSVVEDFQVLNTSCLIPMLVKSVQELKDQNDALLARIEILEGN